MRPRAHPHEHALPPGADELRARGRRLTEQRRLIWQALTQEPESHLSADDVVASLRGELPHLNPSTIYRTLDLLVEEGLLVRNDLGGGRAYYEPVHEHPHHHLVCERCGAVSHIHDGDLGDLRARVKNASGYALGPREITLFGLCPGCRNQAPRG